jgi:hypothetical protein
MTTMTLHMHQAKKRRNAIDFTASLLSKSSFFSIFSRLALVRHTAFFQKACRGGIAKEYAPELDAWAAAIF